MIKIASTLLSITLFIAGCGGGSSEKIFDYKNSNLAEVTEENTIKLAGSVLSNQGNASSYVRSANRNILSSLPMVEKAFNRVNNKNSIEKRTNAQENSVEVEYCADYGYVVYTKIINRTFQYLQLTMEVNNCYENDSLVNGEAIITLFPDSNGDLGSYLIEYTQDYIIENKNSKIINFKGSSLEASEIKTETDGTLISITMKHNGASEMNGEYLGAKDLVIVSKAIHESYQSYHLISGEQYIDKGYFLVDTTYDSSQTPMVFDDFGNLLQNGLFTYIGENNSKIEIKATNTNELTINYDSNGDGTLDKEVIKNF